MEKSSLGGFDTAAFGTAMDLTAPGAEAEDRVRAFDRYLAIPAPHMRMEEWRRTDPALFPLATEAWAFKEPDHPVAAPSEAGSFDAAVTLGGAEAVVEDHGVAIRDGRIEILPLQEAFARYPDAIAEVAAGIERSGGMGKHEALVHAFWNQGLFIRVRPDIELSRGILIRYVLPPGRKMLISRLILDVGARSRLAVMECHEPVLKGAGLLMSSREARVAAGAGLRIFAIQDGGPDDLYLSTDWARVERDGLYEWGVARLGGRAAKATSGVDLCGPGARAEMRGLYFGTDEQHLDQRTIQVHSASQTESNLLYKGAVRDESHSVYQGLIVAKHGANGVNAYQKNNNLVLNDGTRTDSLPSLKIDTDDLKCGHGSTVGSLDPEHIFYLRSRGLDDIEARRILLKGFFEEVIERIPEESLRERVRGRIERKMGAQAAEET